MSSIDCDAAVGIFVVGCFVVVAVAVIVVPLQGSGSLHSHYV